ncbi:chromosome partitioning protein ParB [Nostoc sp. 3335mG]|nr:chromosome partitioning protein ParB [Nostoc sp. 3335mG]
MKLEFIELDKLYVDPANMRFAKGQPDVTDILPSIRKRGILQNLIVRADGEDRFGILAGARRFRAAEIVAAGRAEDDSEPFLLPCAILETGDDADAVEASVIENMARLDPDEVTRWESFVRLVREGRSPEDIAKTFALPVLSVRRTLALGNLLPRIRDLHRYNAIDIATVRHLTLATRARQKAWLELWDAPDAHCPTGWELRAWLLGGRGISAHHALFDIEAAGLAVVADLFAEQRYFADAEAFWRAQNAAVEARRAAYLEAGWSGVEIIGPTQHFHGWEHEKTPKRKGGRVFIDVRADGEVVFHEGYLHAREARRIARGEAPEAAPAKPVRPELSGPLQTYIDLHRHAAVRAALLARPGVALRLMVAHAIAGSHLWRVDPEPQQARSDAVQESVETCRGETVFDEKRRTMLALLGFDPEAPTLCRGHGGHGVVGVFLCLLDLPDADLMDVIAVLMGETLAAGSAAVEAAGSELGVSMAAWWEADDAFLALVRDKEVLAHLVADVAGKTIADANAGATGKAMRRIVADHLTGAGGRAKVELWVPRWMAFPPSAYTTRGGVGTLDARAELDAALAARASEPQPEPRALAA